MSLLEKIFRPAEAKKSDDALEKARTFFETLTAYAQRRLEEESMVYDVRTYTREWWPDIFPFSVVRGSLASVDLDGDLRVVSQTLTCGLGITVEEQSRRETYTWRRA